jgi:phosphate transport system substrate-binding protein
MTFSEKVRRISRKSEAPPATVALLLAIVATPLPFVAPLLDRPVLAQSPSPVFPVPSAVPSGTTLRINGSSSMEAINDALQQRFESQFSGTTVESAYEGSDTALQELLNGTIDLAAIGRPLTEQEQAQGLVAVPVTRNKIAVVVGAENPFNGSLTSDQFAQIFRGEVTSWSQVGGEPGPIRLIDRPDDSDTRRAFQSYPVFQTAPFATGANAVKLSEDSTDAVLNELGADGIGYAIAEQVAGNANVRSLLMHETPPTDPRYPFSQPLSYVYRGPEPSPEVQAFLGYATAPENQVIVEDARRAGLLAAGAAAGAATIAQSPSPAVSPETSPTAAPEVSPSPPAATADPSPETTPDATSRSATESTPETTTETERAAAPWWLWLLAIPLIGALLWWLLRDRGVAPVAAPVVAAADPESRIILTPRNCRDGYVYWEVPDRVTADIPDGRLKVRLYDVTDIDLERQPPHDMTQFDCANQAQDLHVTIPVDNRDYVAELGYLAEDDRWVAIARSPHVRVPACEPAPDGTRAADTRTANTTGIPLAAVAAGVAGAAGATAAARSIANPQLVEEHSRIIMTPRSAKTAYVYWEVPDEHMASLRQQGGQELKLRVYDTTGIEIDEQPAHSVREYACDPASQDLHIPIPSTDRDYVAELGYVTENGRWLRLARSSSMHMPTPPAESQSAPQSAVASAAPTSDASSPVSARLLNPPAEPSISSSAPETAAYPTEQADLPSRTTPARADDRRKISPSDAAKATGAAVAGMATGAGLAQAMRRSADSPVDDRATDSGIPAASAVETKPQCRIILVPRSDSEAYAYWEVSDQYHQQARRQGGQILMLRIHDVTDLDLDYQPAHSTQDYVCAEGEQDHHVTIPVSDRDYLAELGYVTEDGRWLRLIRSFHVRIPSSSQG